jgi:hypothetical protein
MSITLFVVSDVHGHYTELIKALNEAGFDKDNPKHYFVSCGDLFDRGTENTKVYEFVKSLRRKFLIKGNHEDMLYNALERGYITRTDVLNGTDITILEFLGGNAINSSGYINKIDNKAKIYELMSFIDYMRSYYENGKYIFRLKTNGQDCVKTPFGMFETETMENDLKEFDKVVREYYDLDNEESEKEGEE